MDFTSSGWFPRKASLTGGLILPFPQFRFIGRKFREGLIGHDRLPLALRVEKLPERISPDCRNRVRDPTLLLGVKLMYPTYRIWVSAKSGIWFLWSLPSLD